MTTLGESLGPLSNEALLARARSDRAQTTRDSAIDYMLENIPGNRQFVADNKLAQTLYNGIGMIDGLPHRIDRNFQIEIALRDLTYRVALDRPENARPETTASRMHRMKLAVQRSLMHVLRSPEQFGDPQNRSAVEHLLTSERSPFKMG